MEPDRLSSWMERALAYFLAISPPLALVATLALFIRRRPSIGLLVSDRWTVACGLILGLLGTISAILAPSQLLAAQGPLALGLLFLAWVIGRFLVQDARRFWTDLQRGIAVVAVVALAWVVSPFTFQISAGPVTVPVARPHDPVAVFGLGANGLGLLLTFGAVLALGRLVDESKVAGRVEAMLIAAGALGASLAIGVRSALLGTVAGAVTLLPARGMISLLAIAAIAALTLWIQPAIWPSFLAPAQAETLKLRTITWLSAIAMVRDRPWLGIGPFHFSFAKPAYLPTMAGGIDPEPFAGPHNIYLRLASEWGLPAAVLLTLWLISWPVRLWRFRKIAWKWSLVAGFIAFLVMGLFEDPLFTLHISGPVFAGLGLAASDATASNG